MFERIERGTSPALLVVQEQSSVRRRPNSYVSCGYYSRFMLICKGVTLENESHFCCTIFDYYVKKLNNTKIGNNQITKKNNEKDSRYDKE